MSILLNVKQCPNTNTNIYKDMCINNNMASYFINRNTSFILYFLLNRIDDIIPFV